MDFLLISAGCYLPRSGWHWATVVAFSSDFVLSISFWFPAFPYSPPQYLSFSFYTSSPSCPFFWGGTIALSLTCVFWSVLSPLLALLFIPSFSLFPHTLSLLILSPLRLMSLSPFPLFSSLLWVHAHVHSAFILSPHYYIFLSSHLSTINHCPIYKTVLLSPHFPAS